MSAFARPAASAANVAARIAVCRLGVHDFALSGVVKSCQPASAAITSSSTIANAAGGAPTPIARLRTADHTAKPSHPASTPMSRSRSGCSNRGDAPTTRSARPRTTRPTAARHSSAAARQAALSAASMLEVEVRARTLVPWNRDC